MKTTIKTSETQAIAVAPAGDGITLTFLNLRKPAAVVKVDNITIGALLWAVEQAAQAAQLATQRDTACEPASEPHRY